MREIQNRGRTANDVWGDFKFSVATGKISGLSQRQKYGMNDDINGSFVDVWTVGDTLTYQTSAQTLTVVSASANDDIDSTGVKEVRVEYLDGNFETKFVDVEMNGTTSVTVADDFLRLQSVYVLQVGSGGGAADDITFSANGSVQGRIESGSNALESTHFTIPAGFTGYIVGANIGVGKADDVQVILRSRNASVDNSPFITSDEFELFQTSSYFSLPTYYVIPEKHDILIQARSLGGANRRAFVTYHLILRANEIYRND